MSTPRRLTNLATVRVAIVTGESSYHQAFDHCTAQFLNAANVRTDVLDLGKLGIHGNGHMMMLEKNSSDIIKLVSAWAERVVAARR